MSAYKSYFLVLFLLINGCASQQMSGSSQSKQSSSSSGGMPSSSSSSSMPSSSPGGMPSSISTPSSSGTKSMPPGANEGNASSQSGSEGVEGRMDNPPPDSPPPGPPGANEGNAGSQTATSIFNESLGDFDKEMAGERDIIAASSQGDSSMTAQEIADIESIMGADLDGPIDISGDLGNDESQGNNDSEDEFTGEMSEEEISRLPSCIDIDGSGEDKIARQLRVFAIKEDDPNIRNEIWKQYLKHMGIGQLEIEKCLSK
ncbi:MAG: hypothetical protein P8M55_03570 [Gammaproteobacteria bacterium]|nr:hypothetical protein [Gammaproteobacteria bacterium]